MCVCVSSVSVIDIFLDVCVCVFFTFGFPQTVKRLD